MRILFTWLLFIATAFALRRSGRSSAIQATSEKDAAGRWTAKAGPDMFSSNLLTMSLPGGHEMHFDCQPSISLLADADGQGVAVQKGSSGTAQLSAVQRSDSGRIAGSIVDPKADMVHKFSGEKGGELSFVSIPSANFPDEGDPLGDGVADTAAASNGTELQADPVMDTIVVWTRDSECRNGGMPAGCTPTSDSYQAMLATISLAVAETNQAYDNSGVNAQIRLVLSFGNYSYQERSFGEALNDVTVEGNGKLDEVHTWRSQYKADLVVLLIDDPQYCGLAWLGPSKDRMFSVTAWNCATGYFSFGHEIGHNLGCNHDLGTKGACATSNYNYGWRDPNSMFRTVMAYNCRSGQCDAGNGAGCTRVNWFSNPAVSYNGRPTGSSRANNARQINDVAATVANYY